MLSNQKDQDPECKIKMNCTISNCEAFQIFNNLMNPIKFSPFQYCDQKNIQEIQKLITEKSDSSFFRKVLRMIQGYYQHFRDLQQNILTKDNILIIFLLSLQIEIDIPCLEIRYLILPIQFNQQYLQIINQNHNFNEHRQLFDKLCEDFGINNVIYNSMDIYPNFYKLFYQLCLKPINQTHQDLLNQFQQNTQIIDSQNQNNFLYRNMILSNPIEKQSQQQEVHNNPIEEQQDVQIPIYPDNTQTIQIQKIQPQTNIQQEQLEENNNQKSADQFGRDSLLVGSLDLSVKEDNFIVQNQPNETIQTIKNDINLNHQQSNPPKANPKTQSKIILISKSTIAENQFQQIRQITIFKVKYAKSLIKQQNQEIILSKCSGSLLPLGKDNVIYYNQKYDIKLSQQYNKRILYTGGLNYNYEIQGQGQFKQIDINITYEGRFDQGVQNGEGKQIFLNTTYEGYFSQGQKYGCFKITDRKLQQVTYGQFENDSFKEYYINEENFNQKMQQQLSIEPKFLEKDIVHVKEYYLSTKIINTLKIGSWLQDSIIDWYLMELKNHYKQLHQDKVNYTLFNVMNSQDVFSSQLNYENFDFTQVEKFINIPFLQKQVENSKNAQTGTLAKRTIFAMNLNRQHFITIVIDNNQIYFLNSLQSDLSNIGKILKESYLKIGLEIHYHPDNQIQILQQKNFYSCGVHTCYVIHQLIKHYNVPIKDIQFNNTEAKIEKYTIHMRNVIFTKKSIHIEAQTL